MDKKGTLNDVIEEYRMLFKYLRVFELNKPMSFEIYPHYQFNKFILVSNELEYFESTELEIENLMVNIELAQVKLRILRFWDLSPEIRAEKQLLPFFELIKKE